jgi:cyanate permease
VVRYLHLAVGVALGAYVYLPLHLEAIREVLRVSLMFVGVPAIVATGFWLWQGPRVRAAVRRSRRRTDAADPT